MLNILQSKVKVYRIYVFLQGVNPGHHKEIAIESQNASIFFFSGGYHEESQNT